MPAICASSKQQQYQSVLQKELKHLVELDEQLEEAKESLRPYIALPENCNKTLYDVAQGIAKDQYNAQISLEISLSCPIGITCFTKFLETGM